MQVTLNGSNVTEGIANFTLNLEGTLLANTDRTASPTSPNQTNYNARGVIIIVKVIAASGTGGLTPKIIGRTPSGALYQLNVNPTAITTVGTFAFEVYPGSTGAGGTEMKQRTSGALPRTWYVACTHGDSTIYTYSVEYALIL